MAQQVTQLESILAQLIEEHRRMLSIVEAQHAAVKTLGCDMINDATNRLEACRVRLSQIEQRRRLQVSIIAKLVNGTPQMTITQIAAAFPQHAAKLTELGKELKASIAAVQQHTHVIAKVSTALLGHLNGALRAFARAVGSAGTYTKAGVPKVSNRIGVMNAVG